MDVTRSVKWEWVQCEDGYCVIAPPYQIRPLKIVDHRIKKYMGESIAKYDGALPKFLWKRKRKRGVVLMGSNSGREIVDTILQIAAGKRIFEKKNDYNVPKPFHRTELKQKVSDKEAFITIGRVLNKRLDKSIFSSELILQWSDVRFYDRYFIFNPNLGERIGRNKIEPLRVEDFRCKRSFNYIIGYFQERLPKITYRITSDFKIELDSKPLFEEALIYLVKEQRRRDVGEVRIKNIAETISLKQLSFTSAMSKASSMTIDNFKKYKSQFIDFLVECQAKEYKIVPAIETIANSRAEKYEECFIFTTKSLFGVLFIIMENVNPDRATMIFKVRKDKYMIAACTIFEYVQSDMRNKRSAVRDGKVDFDNSGILDYWTSNHDTFHDWKIRMLSYIK